MNLRLYLKLAILLTAVDSIFLTYLYSAGMGDDFVRIYLLAKVVIDAVFVMSNWKLMRPSRFEAALLMILALHAFAGFVLLPMISNAYLPGRAVNDLIGPLFFITKVIMFRGLIGRGDLSPNMIRLLVRSLIVLAVIQIMIFSVLSRSSGAYAGITPPVNVPIAFGLAFSQPWLIAVSMVVILLSGKRSFLLAAVIAISIRSAVQPNNRVPFVIGGAVVILVMVLVGGAASGMIPEAILDKMRQSSMIFDLAGIVFRDGPGALFDESVRHDLYLATAGRSEEIFAIIANMNWYNFFTGLGAGFTYSYMHWDGWMDGYANSHFSPLALTYKFGIIFMLCTYQYIWEGVLTLLKGDDKFASMIALAIIIFVVESFFAFNLFVEVFLPLLVALRQLAVTGDLPRSEKTRPATIRGESNVRV